MTKEDLIELFCISDILDLPRAIMSVIEGSMDKRNEVFIKLLELNKFDVSLDWFQAIYEEEFAQRKQAKQDFTPDSVSVLASLITGNRKGWVYEPTAGNGSMIINDWWQRCISAPYPILHHPSQNLVHCVELSDRAIPILLLNLSIRGMMGYVYHGDVLTQELKCKYILLNKNDDTLGFSEIIADKENILWIEGTTINNEIKLFKPIKKHY